MVIGIFGPDEVSNFVEWVLNGCPDAVPEAAEAASDGASNAAAGAPTGSPGAPIIDPSQSVTAGNGNDILQFGADGDAAQNNQAATIDQDSTGEVCAQYLKSR